jgi:hypothetical protein
MSLVWTSQTGRGQPTLGNRGREARLGMEPQLVAQRITRWYSSADLGGAVQHDDPNRVFDHIDELGIVRTARAAVDHDQTLRPGRDRRRAGPFC